MNEGLDVRLNVNLSAREFQEGDLVAFFDEVVERTAVDASRLNLELTEKSFIKKLKDVRKVLEELKTRGPQLWLDDFGTGHSSIEHLKEFPVDGIKIPATYVKDITSNEISRAITGSLVRLAGDLGMNVVAEGVETDEQLAIVNDLGCFWIQGYLIARPMPFDHFREEVRNSCRRRWRE
jgi:EAL domain-containing protein (putative c-di-GMP-specific phosphodiesterase class I)